jgi:probable O-glycosylation ligase (exosortase A-associated)
MKQLAFMIFFTVLGTLGVFVIRPFWGPFVYYLFAVLRPQYMWQWSLPTGIDWSFYVGVTSIVGAFAVAFGFLRADPPDHQPIAHRHRLIWAHWCFLPFCIWIPITGLLARNYQIAEIWIIEYSKIFIMYFVTAYLVRTVQQVWLFYLMCGLVLAYIAYEVNFLYIVHGYLGIYRNGYGGLDNNGAGLMLAMGVPLCYYSFEGIRKWWRWGFLALIPVIVHAVLMTYSRGAMLSLLLVIPLLILRSRQKKFLIIGLLVFGFFILPVLAGKEIEERFLSIQQHEIDESANSRRMSWLAAWRIALDNPLFGVGIRNANLFSYQYGADVFGRTIHSQYLQILADNGFPGLAFYLLAAGTSLISLWYVRRRYRDSKDNDSRRIYCMACGLEASLIVFFIGSTFLSLEVFELPYLLMLLSAQLALVSGVFDCHDDDYGYESTEDEEITDGQIDQQASLGISL